MIDDIQTILAEKKAEPLRLALCRKDMLHYARYIFDKYYENPLLEGWYHTLLCRALEKVSNGEIKRLIINMPPSYQKTEFAVRLFVSWFLGNYPKKRVIYTSYSDDLATKTPSEVKQIIKSEHYKKIFEGIRLGEKTADKEWYLETRGGMFSTTVGGGITGFHGNIVIIDDPMKAIEKNSKASRDTVTEFYRSSILSRLRNEDPNSAIIVIMQRLHEHDLVGYLMEYEPNIWTHINITGVEEKEVEYQFYDFYYKRPAHEPLNSKLEDYEKLMLKKAGMREDWYSQYMQDPRQIETGYVLKDDFVSVASHELTLDNQCISIDPAQSTKETADNRAISKVGACEIDGVEIHNVYWTRYGKWSNDEFVDQIIQAMLENPELDVYMESSGGGILTEQNLKKKIREVNAKLIKEGKKIISHAKVHLFNPKTKISKNQKIERYCDRVRNRQVRFVIGGAGHEQTQKETLAFHPEKDSKEDDCMETIANVIVNEFVKAKIIKDKTPIKIADRKNEMNQSRRAWRI